MNKRLIALLTVGVLVVGGAAVFKTLRKPEAYSPIPAGLHVANVEEAVSASEPAKDPEAKVTTTVPVPLNRPVRVAIGSLGFANSEEDARVGDLVLTELSGATGIDLVERKSLSTALKELQLNLSGLVRAGDAIRAGQLLKADWFLVGTPALFHGANATVLRLVDVRTGISLDGKVFSRDKPLPDLGAEIATFVRQARQTAANGKTPIYLGVGSLLDSSLNARETDFSEQFRGYLTAAFQGTDVTMVEREYVDMLLHEVQLDLAGLTQEQESANKTPVAFQSAFWLINGNYQSFETQKLELELKLEVQQIFGQVQRVSLHGEPGEPICRQAKDAVEKIIRKKGGEVVPTRMSEARTQFLWGKELAENSRGPANREDFTHNPDGTEWGTFDPNGGLKVPEGLMRRRTLEDAIKAFKTVLLLTPTNSAAKLYLAACLRDSVVGRPEEARDYYRELFESDPTGPLAEKVKNGLVDSFNDRMFHVGDPQAKFKWFEAAAAQTTQSNAAAFYSAQAKAAEVDAIAARGGTPEAETILKQRLWTALGAFRDTLKKGNDQYFPNDALYTYVISFPSEREASQRLTELLPDVRKDFPEIVPYFLGEAMTHQSETNGAVVDAFEHEFAQIKQHTKTLIAPTNFWKWTIDPMRWSFRSGAYGLAAEIMEYRLAYETEGQQPGFGGDVEDKVRLGYAYMALRRWQQAEDIFKGITNRIVNMTEPGLWSPADFGVVLPRHAAEFCAKKLGQPLVRDPREFDLEPSCFCFCSASAFALDDSGLWIAINDQLMHLDFNLKTNLVVPLPDSDNPITCMCITAGAVWVGTDGAGLIKFDKGSRACRRFKVDDGLLTDRVACLKKTESSLWIGYGHRSSYYGFDFGGGWSGGLGRLDLTTQKFTSFMPSIVDGTPGGANSGDGPTRNSVTMLAPGSDDAIYFVAEENSPMLHSHRPREKTWQRFFSGCTGLASDSKRLFVTQYSEEASGSPNATFGVSYMDLDGGQWKHIRAFDEVPKNVASTVAPVGKNIWVGGKGYLALIDLEEEKILKFAQVPSQAATQIEIGGGFVWIVYDGRLHRAAL